MKLSDLKQICKVEESVTLELKNTQEELETKIKKYFELPEGKYVSFLFNYNGRTFDMFVSDTIQIRECLFSDIGERVRVKTYSSLFEVYTYFLENIDSIDVRKSRYGVKVKN